MSEIELPDAAPDDTSLRRVVGGVARWRDLKAKIANLQYELDQSSKALLMLERETLPDDMLAAGVSSFTTRDGTTVEVKPLTICNLPKKDDETRRKLALDWLGENGASSIIKVEVTASFAAGHEEQAKALLEYVVNIEEAEPSYDKGVHPSTLSKWARERLAEGEKIETPLLDTYYGRIAKVTLPKRRVA